jgi:hypothetical protein
MRLKRSIALRLISVANRRCWRRPRHVASRSGKRWEGDRYPPFADIWTTSRPIPKLLQAHCEQRYSARNVPGKVLKGGASRTSTWRTPRAGNGGQLDLHCRVPGRDLVEIAGKLTRGASSVLPLLAGPEGLSIFWRQGEPVNDPKGEDGRLAKADVDEAGGVAHSVIGAWAKPAASLIHPPGPG